MNIAVIIIIAINVLFSLKGFNDYNFFQRYKLNSKAVIQNKQYDRILTSGFLHVDYTHLIFNMLSLYFFANIVIAFFASPDYVLMKRTGIEFSLIRGYILFFLTFIFAVIGGNLLALFFHKNNPGYSAVGASGGVMGIVMAAITIAPLDLDIYGFIPGWLFAILYLGYSVYGVQKQLGNIGHEAHLGGAVVGLIAPIIFYPEIFNDNKWYILGMLVPIAVLFVLAVRARK
jgi:membrane associated rhomboid family serine protease